MASSSGSCMLLAFAMAAVIIQTINGSYGVTPSSNSVPPAQAQPYQFVADAVQAAPVQQAYGQMEAAPLVPTAYVPMPYMMPVVYGRQPAAHQLNISLHQAPQISALSSVQTHLVEHQPTNVPSGGCGPDQSGQQTSCKEINEEKSTPVKTQSGPAPLVGASGYSSGHYPSKETLDRPQSYGHYGAGMPIVTMHLSPAVQPQRPHLQPVQPTAYGMVPQPSKPFGVQPGVQSPFGETDLCGASMQYFQASPQRNIAGSVPFERRAEISCEQCMQLCLQWCKPNLRYSCKTAIYDFQHLTCDLHSVVADNKYHTLVPSRTTTYFVPVQCPATTAFLFPLPTVPTPVATQPATVVPKPVTEPATDSVEEQAAPVPTTGVEEDEETEETFEGEPAVQPAASDLQQCRPGEKRWIATLKNYDDKTVKGSVINGLSKDACFGLCQSDQKYVLGKPLGLAGSCRTVIYNQKGQCVISDKHSSSFSSVTPARNSEYGVMLCLSAQHTTCGKPILLADLQTILVGFARKVTTAGSYNECIAKCFANNNKKTTFVCHSGMYFFQSRQCVLNSESRQTHSETLVKEPKSLVVYFDDGCQAEGKSLTSDTVITIDLEIPRSPYAADQPIVTEWAEWSSCSGSQTLSVRYRNCSEPNPMDCPKEIRTCEEAEEEKEEDMLKSEPTGTSFQK